MSVESLEAEAARWAVVRDDLPLPCGLQGAYDDERGVIYLRPGLSPMQRRCVLAHEISHARHHDLGCRTDSYAEARADKEAARMLIDPLEYAAAERIYDNEISLAKELDVLPWVVRAYRAWLNESLAA